jgi:myo-inositol-1-phosphate synthase
MSKVGSAIIGVGNCTSALIQGLSQVITKAPSVPPNIISILQETGTDVVVNDLPVGA